MLNLSISREGFLWGLSIASQLHHIPLPTTLILQKYKAPYTLMSFKVAAEQVGFKVRQKAIPTSQLEKLTLPCLCTLIPANGIPKNSDAEIEYQIGLLEKVEADYVTFAEACGKEITKLPRHEFEKRFAGEVLIVSSTLSDKRELKKVRELAQKAAKDKSGKISLSLFFPQPAWLKAMFRNSR